MIIVVDIRITLRTVRRREPMVSSGRKAIVPGSRRQESGTPAGSKSGACRHRGNSGTWESHLSPCVYSRSGGPGDQKPWRGRGASTRPRALAGHHEQIEAGKVLGSERQAKRPGTGSVAVLAEHSTWEGGKCGPSDPLEGRRRRASRGAERKDGSYLEITNRHPNTSAPCSAGRP
jgi:hypothetical protein